MFRINHHVGQKFRLVFLGGLAAALMILGLSGCSSWNLRGDPFADNSMSSSVRQARPPMKNAEFWGFSNKARQIEEDCGVGEAAN
jgi:hypothetical protein